MIMGSFTCKYYIVSKEYLKKNKFGLITVLAIVVIAYTTNARTTDTATQQNDTVAPNTWDRSYGGADKSYDTELLRLRELIAPRFQTLKFDDKVTGKTMTYNLYIPIDYDQRISYPLVLFMADASITGKGALAPLKQGYGAIIWATDESQAEQLKPFPVSCPACYGLTANNFFS